MLLSITFLEMSEEDCRDYMEWSDTEIIINENK